MAAPLGTIQLDGSVRKLDPKMRILWAVRSAAWAVIIGGGLLVFTAAGNASPVALGGYGALVLLWLVAAIGFAHLKWKRWSWSAWPDAVDLRHGVVTGHESVVPYHRIQQIDIHRGPVERMLGLSTLILRTAAATTDAELPGIPAAHAEGLRHDLLDRSGHDDAV